MEKYFISDSFKNSSNKNPVKPTLTSSIFCFCLIWVITIEATCFFPNKS